MQVCYYRQKLRYYVSEKINPKDWDEKRQRVKGLKSNVSTYELNTLLDNMRNLAKATFRKYYNDSKEIPTPDKLKQLIDTAIGRTTVIRKDFWTFFDDIIVRSINGTRTYGKSGTRINENTIKTYKTTYTHLKNFQNYRRRIITFENIDLDFYNNFIEYLSKIANTSVNTNGKQISNLKMILNEAYEAKLHTNQFYQSKRFITTREESDNIYLSTTELEEIYSLDLTNNLRLDKVRDLFLIGCYTGLRFSDYSNIKPEYISGDRLNVRTKKTGADVSIPIHSIVRKIINKYEHALPIGASNQKTNQYLKEIGRMIPSLHQEVYTSITKAGVEVTEKLKKWEMLCTHTARRSFATNQYKAGVPAITIMQITGHKTEKAFLKYIKLTNQEHAELLAAHWNKSE